MNNDKKKIYKDMMSDSKVQDYLKSKDKPESIEEMSNVLGGVAMDYGYPLSSDDFLDIFKAQKERTDSAVDRVGKLSETDLSNVVGGGNNAANASCCDTYKDKENCWANDGCDYIINWYDQYICKRNELDSIWEIVPYNP